MDQGSFEISKKKKLYWSEEDVEILRQIVNRTKTNSGISMAKIMAKKTSANNQKLKE